MNDLVAAFFYFVQSVLIFLLCIFLVFDRQWKFWNLVKWIGAILMWHDDEFKMYTSYTNVME